MPTRTGKKPKANHATDRSSIQNFEEIINVGPAVASDFRQLGMSGPQHLIGKDPLSMYRKICKLSGYFHDPCVLDVFMASVDYMNGNPPKQWWGFTAERKTRYTEQVDQLRAKYDRPPSNKSAQS